MHHSLSRLPELKGPEGRLPPVHFYYILQVLLLKGCIIWKDNQLKHILDPQ